MCDYGKNDTCFLFLTFALQFATLIDGMKNNHKSSNFMTHIKQEQSHKLHTNSHQTKCMKTKHCFFIFLLFLLVTKNNF